MFFIIFCSIFLQLQAVPYDINCYQQSPQLAGAIQGLKVSDYSTLNFMIKNLGPTYISAAVKSCFVRKPYSSSDGDLTGHQLAITDYASLPENQTQPLESDLKWLPGVGITTVSDGIKCEVVVLKKNVFINYWSSKFDTQSVITSYFQTTDGQFYFYGNPPYNQKLSQQEFKFNYTSPLIGLWGYEQFSIAALGMITYNSSTCREPIVIPPQPVKNTTNITQNNSNTTNLNTTNSSIVNNTQIIPIIIQNITTDLTPLYQSETPQKFNTFEIAMISGLSGLAVVIAIFIFLIWFIRQRKSGQIENRNSLQQHQRVDSEQPFALKVESAGVDESLPDNSNLTETNLLGMTPISDLTIIDEKQDKQLVEEQEILNEMDSDIQLEVARKPSNSVGRRSSYASRKLDQFSNYFTLAKSNLDVATQQPIQDQEDAQNDNNLPTLIQEKTPISYEIIEEDDIAIPFEEVECLQPSIKENSLFEDLPRNSVVDQSIELIPESDPFVKEPETIKETYREQILPRLSITQQQSRNFDEVIQPVSNELFTNVDFQVLHARLSEKRSDGKLSRSASEEQQAPRVQTNQSPKQSEIKFNAEERMPYQRNIKWPHKEFLLRAKSVEQFGNNGQQGNLRNQSPPFQTRQLIPISDRIKIQKMIYLPQQFKRVQVAVENDKDIEEAVRAELRSQKSQDGSQQRQPQLLSFGSDSRQQSPPYIQDSRLEKISRILNDGRQKKAKLIRNGKFIISGITGEIIDQPPELERAVAKPPRLLLEPSLQLTESRSNRSPLSQYGQYILQNNQGARLSRQPSNQKL